MRLLPVCAGSFFVVALVASCSESSTPQNASSTSSGGSSTSSSSGSSSSGSTSSTSSGSSSGGESKVDKYSAAPAQTIDTSKTYKATMVTAKGTIELSLDAKAAPKTVNNFVFLAREKFYDGLKFHRVEAGFVIQGGDPAGSGAGGPGYTIPDETSSLTHVDGALAMAKTKDPDSAGSQFYITLGAQPDLDGRYTVFGTVTTGKDVPGKIVKDDVIESVTITEE